ncbi:MAG: hypothetical protein J0G94_10415 [Sphingomonadales bacterium]|nr:hypothetical protein [Sphingomonadales bacterium]
MKAVLVIQRLLSEKLHLLTTPRLLLGRGGATVPALIWDKRKPGGWLPEDSPSARHHYLPRGGQFDLLRTANAGVGLGVATVTARNQFDFLFVELFNENFVNHRRLLLYVGKLRLFGGYLMVNDS